MASSRESIANHAVTFDARKRGISIRFCCNRGSMKFATHNAAAAHSKRRRGFSLLTANMQGELTPADPDVLHWVSARFAIHSPGFLEGATLDWRAGGPNAAQPEL